MIPISSLLGGIAAVSISNRLQKSFAKVVSVTQVGAPIKEVTCEQCEFEYVYQLLRTAEGSVRGWEEESASNYESMYKKAESRAQAKLSRELKTACDVVPCPKCGRCQKDMVAQARRSLLRSLPVVGLILLPLLILLGMACICGSVLWADLGALLEAVVLLVILILVWFTAAVMVWDRFLSWQILRWGYNPNAQDEDARIERGRTRAVSREAYLGGTVVPPLPYAPNGRSW
jgi:hypothetical protein